MITNIIQNDTVIRQRLMAIRNKTQKQINLKQKELSGMQSELSEIDNMLMLNASETVNETRKRKRSRKTKKIAATRKRKSSKGFKCKHGRNRDFDLSFLTRGVACRGYFRRAFASENLSNFETATVVPSRGGKKITISFSKNGGGEFPLKSEVRAFGMAPIKDKIPVDETGVARYRFTEKKRNTYTFEIIS